MSASPVGPLEYVMLLIPAIVLLAVPGPGCCGGHALRHCAVQVGGGACTRRS